MPRYQDTCNVLITCKRIIDFPTCGSCVWTVPSSVTCATFEAWGAGGSGGARCDCNCYRSAPGGAPGGYARTSIVVVPGSQYSICVGPGGSVDSVGACAQHWCHHGQQGGTTYVTGTNLSNFCATGGDGSTNCCYNTGGCNIQGGIGYGATITASGGISSLGGFIDAQPMILETTGSSPFTSNNQFFVKDHCTPCQCGHPGVFPGGGGTSPSHYNCCCYSAGVGANGLVRIIF